MVAGEFSCRCYPTHSAQCSEMLSENDVSRAEQSLYRIRQELAVKRDEANRAPPTPSKGWMGRFFTADQGIGAELDGLQAMERQMARSLKQLKKRKVGPSRDWSVWIRSRQGQQEFSRTLLGQAYNLVGYGFAVYCGARLMMVSWGEFAGGRSTHVSVSLPSSFRHRPSHRSRATRTETGSLTLSRSLSATSRLSISMLRSGVGPSRCC
jgi:hypothetical protein